MAARDERVELEKLDPIVVIALVLLTAIMATGMVFAILVTTTSG